MGGTLVDKIFSDDWMNSENLIKVLVLEVYKKVDCLSTLQHYANSMAILGISV